MKFAVIVLILIFAMNIFIGDSRLMYNFSDYLNQYSSLRPFFIGIGAILLTLFAVFVFFQVFHHFKYKIEEDFDEEEDVEFDSPIGEEFEESVS